MWHRNGWLCVAIASATAIEESTCIKTSPERQSVFRLLHLLLFSFPPIHSCLFSPLVLDSLNISSLHCCTSFSILLTCPLISHLLTSSPYNTMHTKPTTSKYAPHPTPPYSTPPHTKLHVTLCPPHTHTHLTEGFASSSAWISGR